MPTLPIELASNRPAKKVEKKLLVDLKRSPRQQPDAPREESKTKETVSTVEHQSNLDPYGIGKETTVVQPTKPAEEKVKFTKVGVRDPTPIRTGRDSAMSNKSSDNSRLSKEPIASVGLKKNIAAKTSSTKDDTIIASNSLGIKEVDKTVSIDPKSQTSIDMPSPLTKEKSSTMVGAEVKKPEAFGI